MYDPLGEDLARHFLDHDPLGAGTDVEARAASLAQAIQDAVEGWFLLASPPAVEGTRPPDTEDR